MRDTSKKVLFVLATGAILLLLAGPVLPSVLASQAAQDWDTDMGPTVSVNHKDGQWHVEGADHTVVMDDEHDLLEIEFKVEPE